MPETLSIDFGSDWLGYAELNRYARSGSAVSEEVKTSQNLASNITAIAENSKSLFGKKLALLEQLYELEHDCAEDGWNAGAVALDSEALTRAHDFVMMLPDGFPVPECSPEPDGFISLDWIFSRYRMFSLSVGPSDRVAYAWLDGTDKGHGVARLDGCSLPRRVLNDIRAIMNYGAPTLRVA